MEQRWRAVTTAVLVVVLAAVGVVGSLTHEPSAAGGPLKPASMRVEVQDGGIAFLVRTDFPQDVRLTRPRAQVGNADMRAYLLPEDQRRSRDRAHRRAVVPAGTTVALVGILVPDCAADLGGGVGFTVSARTPDGLAVRRSLGVTNPWLMRQAVNDWCHRPPTVRLSSCRFGADGDAEIHMLVRNHGPDELSVEVPAYDARGVEWDAVSTYVEVGQEVDIVLRGRGVDEGDPTSWGDGRLLLDGEPFHVRSDDAYCG